MEFLAEWIGELFGGILEVTFESKSVKKWVKTALFALMTTAITVFFVVLGIACCLDGNLIGGMILLSIAVGLTVFFLLGGISRHRRGWKARDGRE